MANENETWEGRALRAEDALRRALVDFEAAGWTRQALAIRGHVSASGARFGEPSNASGPQFCAYEDCDQEPTGPDGLCDGHREFNACLARGEEPTP